MFKIALSSLFLLSTTLSSAYADAKNSVVVSMPKAPKEAQIAAKTMFEESHDKIFKAPNDQAAVNVMISELNHLLDVEDISILIMGGKGIVEKINAAKLGTEFHKVIIDTVAALYASQIRSNPNAKVKIQKQTTENDRILGKTLQVVELTIYPEYPSEAKKVPVKLYYNEKSKLVDISVDNSFRMALTLKTQWKGEWDKSGEDANAFLEGLKNSRQEAQNKRAAKKSKAN